MIGSTILYRIHRNELRKRLPPECRMKELGSWDLVTLMLKQPEIVVLCQLKHFNGTQLFHLLWEQKILHRYECPWECLNGDDLPSVLQQLHGYECPWECLNGDDWGSLLRRYPKLSDKCDFEKLSAKDWVFC